MNTGHSSGNGLSLEKVAIIMVDKALLHSHAKFDCSIKVDNEVVTRSLLMY